MTGPRFSYRPSGLLTLGILAVAGVDAVLLWSAQDALRAGRPTHALVDALWAAVVTALVAEVVVRPRVEADAEGVLVVNPFRTARVPWPALERVDARLSLELLTPSGRITSWAASGSRPTPPRPPRPSGPPGGLPTLKELGTRRPARASGAERCREAIEEVWQEWRGEAAPAAPELHRRWHGRSLAALAVLAVALVAGSLAL